MGKLTRELMTVSEYLELMDDYIVRYRNDGTFEVGFYYPHIIDGGKMGDCFFIKPGNLEKGLMQKFEFSINRYPNKKDMQNLLLAFGVER